MTTAPANTTTPRQKSSEPGTGRFPTMAICVVILAILNLLGSTVVPVSAAAGQIDDSNAHNVPLPAPKSLLVNIPLADFDSRAAGDHFPQFKYFRTFGVDFHKPKIDGLYQYVDDDKVEDFIRYTNAHHIQVVWTLFMTTRTLDREVAYVKDLMKRGMNITAFEYGGEYYLPKYARADTTKKGVVEKVTPAIYDRMLKQWLPRFVKILPFSKGDHIIVGASHGNSDSASDRHRRQWNLKVMQPIEQRRPGLINKLSWSFHLYVGNKPRSPKDEEQVVTRADFNFMHDFPPQMKIFVTESGYYIRNFSAEQLHRAGAFWTSEYQALRPGDVFGIHILINKGNRPNPLALINRDGQLSPVGEAFRQWLSTLDGIRGEKAWSGNTPVAVRPNSKSPAPPFKR